MQLAQAVERNSQTISAYGRYCSEMHQGIGENRSMINADREAASTTRVEVSRVRKEISELDKYMDSNNTAIDERFIELEADNANKTTTIAEFTKTLTEAYRTFYEE
jgi:phage host-nuclease inhibitor protein Gam